MTTIIITAAILAIAHLFVWVATESEQVTIITREQHHAKA